MPTFSNVTALELDIQNPLVIPATREEGHDSGLQGTNLPPGRTLLGHQSGTASLATEVRPLVCVVGKPQADGHQSSSVEEILALEVYNRSFCYKE